MAALCNIKKGCSAFSLYPIAFFSGCKVTKKTPYRKCKKVYFYQIYYTFSQFCVNFAFGNMLLAENLPFLHLTVNNKIIYRYYETDKECMFYQRQKM